MSDAKPYIDEQIESIAEDEGIAVQEATQEFLKRSDHIVELDNLKPQEHRWIDRGQVMSCEGAAHPNHRSFKRR